MRNFAAQCLAVLYSKKREKQQVPDAQSLDTFIRKLIVSHVFSGYAILLSNV